MPGGYVGGRPKDETKLSRNPAQIRVRMRRQAKRAKKTGDYSILDRDLAMYKEIEGTGFKPVEEWDLEELARGRPRREDGSFRGGVPSWITHEVERRAKKVLHQTTLGRLGGQVEYALQVIKKLMLSEEVDHNGKPVVDARTKLAAAQFVIEHIIGKPVSQFQLDTVEDVRKVFASAIVLDDGQPDGHPMALEGTVVEDDEEELADDE